MSDVSRQSGPLAPIGGEGWGEGALDRAIQRLTKKGLTVAVISRFLSVLSVHCVRPLLFFLLTFTLSAQTNNPRIRIETPLGPIIAELDAKAAPITVSNFLRYVDGGFFNDARFFRAVTPSNQPNNNIKIQVIQAEANPAREKDFFAPIPLERTRDTGLHHLDGTLSMARDGPDTAQCSFSICIGDQPELDFAGKRNPDGQGFAAFGKVVEGMDTARKIHASPANGQRLTPAIPIHRIVRTK